MSVEERERDCVRGRGSGRVLDITAIIVMPNNEMSLLCSVWHYESVIMSKTDLKHNFAYHHMLDSVIVSKR